MSHIIANLPTVKCFVRKEFLAKRKKDKFSMYFVNDESFKTNNEVFSFLKKNKFNS
jgi:hypothetical protein